MGRHFKHKIRNIIFANEYADVSRIKEVLMRNEGLTPKRIKSMVKLIITRKANAEELDAKIPYARNAMSKNGMKIFDILIIVFLTSILRI